MTEEQKRLQNNRERMAWLLHPVLAQLEAEGMTREQIAHGLISTAGGILTMLFDQTTAAERLLIAAKTMAETTADESRVH